MKLVVIFLFLPTFIFGSFIHKGIQKTYEKRVLDIDVLLKKEKNVENAYILVRKLGIRKYKKIKMKRQGNHFIGKIYAKYATLPGFEYFIVAKQNGKVKNIFNNKWEPQTVRVLRVDRSNMTRQEQRKEIFLKEKLSKGSVTSASRSTQKITEAPSTITVITAKDIENYGVQSLPDLFRYIPGMDVMRISPADANISIRGFNREGSNKILALIDGRPIYMDLFGITFWDVLPISIEDIEKIEIIRGPGSTLYGANAFNGVISIFTKNPENSRGGRISSSVGYYGISQSISSMGNDDLYSYRVSSAFQRNLSFENRDDMIMQNVKANGSFYINSDDENQKITIHTGFVKGSIDSLFSLIGSFEVNDYNQMYLQTEYENKGFKFNVMYDWTDVTATGGFPQPDYIYTFKEGVGSNKIDLVELANIGISLRSLNNPVITGRTHRIETEIQYQKKFGGVDTFLTGINYKFSTLEATGLLDNNFSQQLIGVFLQNELKFGNFIFNIGLRGDFLDTFEKIVGSNINSQGKRVSGEDVPNIFSFSPRGSIVYVINDANVMRLSVGRAFRNPTYLESNMRIELLKSELNNDGTSKNNGVNFNGNQNIGPEKITSLELAYSLDALESKLKFNLNFFYNRVEDLILFKGQFEPLLKVLTGQNITNRENLFNFNNNIDADNYGAEISFSWYVNQYFSFFVNYSYQKTFITNEDKIIKAYNINDIHEITTVDIENPNHKANIGLNFAVEDLYLNIFANYVSATQRNNFITDLGTTGDVAPPSLNIGSDCTNVSNCEVIDMRSNASSFNYIDHWITLNLNIKYKLFNDKLTLGFIGEDLLGSVARIYKHVDDLNEDPEKIGYRGSIKNPRGISSGRHIEYPRSYLFGDVIGGETMGRRFYGYLKLKF